MRLDDPGSQDNGMNTSPSGGSPITDILHNYGHKVATGSYSKATLEEANQTLLQVIAEAIGEDEQGHLTGANRANALQSNDPQIQDAFKRDRFRAELRRRFGIQDLPE